MKVVKDLPKQDLKRLGDCGLNGFYILINFEGEYMFTFDQRDRTYGFRNIICPNIATLFNENWTITLEKALERGELFWFYSEKQTKEFLSEIWARKAIDKK